MSEVHLVVIIHEHGFEAVRIPTDLEIPPVTVEQQALDPRLGLVAASSSMTTLAHVLNAAISEATGAPRDVLQVAD